MALSTCDNWNNPGTKIWMTNFSSWINAFGESIVEWFNNWDTRFMVVSLKTQTFGDE